MPRQIGMGKRLYVCVVCLLFGGAAGCLTGGALSGEAAAALLASASRILKENTAWAALAANLALPVLAVFFALSVLGFLVIPLLQTLHGFALGLGVTLLFRAVGVRLLPLSGVLAALLLYLPCAVWIAASSMRISGGIWAAWRTGGKRTFDAGLEKRRIVAAFLLLLLISALEAVFLSRVWD